MAKDSRSLEMQLRRAKPGEDGKPSIIFIGDGLQLWTSTNRAGKVTKTWVLRYYDVQGKRTKARIGKYPELSLKQAQAQAEDLKGGAGLLLQRTASPFFLLPTSGAFSTAARGSYVADAIVARLRSREAILEMSCKGQS